MVDNEINISQIDEKNEKPLAIKVVLLGETAVGKSSLISRFVDETFISNFIPTMGGGCFSTKNVSIKDKKIKFEIWDTAGQEKYRSLTKMFYKDANVAILVYDITRKDSFEEIKNYWYKEVRDNSPEDIIIAIAENKSDLYEYEEVDKKSVEEFCDNVECIHKRVSAKTGIGVDDLFTRIGIKILFPLNYNKIYNKKNENNINNIKLKKSFLNKNQYENKEVEVNNQEIDNTQCNEDDDKESIDSTILPTKIKTMKKSNCC
jgi:small GTP-binding protein